MADQQIFSYTNRDYEASRAEGLARIPTLSEGVWTDLNATDPGIIMLDYVHALVDMIQYYQDHQALETFLPTAQERENIFRIAEQLSYKPSSSQAARVVVKFSTDFFYDHPILIPKNTIVRTKTGIEYSTIDDTYLETNTSSVDILCQQGKLYSGTYQGTGVSRYTIIDGEYQENQKIHLNVENVDTSTIKVYDANTYTLWTPVDYIIFSESNDRAYQVRLNADNTVTLLFGDGERGRVPQPTDNLVVEYLVHDAEDGRIGIGAITRLKEDISDDTRYVSFIVTNEQPSTGGYSAQDSQSIKELAPGAIKASGRAITRKDFENIAKTVPGVFDAKAYDINNTSSLSHYVVRVLVTPESEDIDSDILVKDVYDKLYACMTPPTILRVSVPNSQPIDITISVKIFENVLPATARSQIIEVVNDYFLRRKGSIGQNFYPADLLTSVSVLSTVKTVLSITPLSMVEVDEFSKITLNNLTIAIE